MRKFLLFGIGMLISFSVFCSVLRNDTSKEISSNTSITLVSSDINTSVIQFTLSDFAFKSVATQRGTQSLIDLPEGIPLYIKGAPDVLRLATSIIIPDKGTMVVNISKSEYTDYENVEIAPSKGPLFICQDVEKIAYEYGEQYSKNEFFPGNLTQLRDPHIMRNIRGQVVDIYPFQYNPVTKVLRVYTSMIIEFKVNTTIEGINSLQTRDFHTMPLEYKEMYEGMYLNFTEASHLRGFTDSPNGRMLMIYYGSFKSAIQPLVDWKTLKGIEIEMIDVSQFSDAAAIKTYVANYYNSHSDLTYLLLVGDYQQLTSTTVSSVSGYPSDQDPGPYAADNKYTLITGNDNYPEIISGRISAQNITEVENQVKKILIYEKTPNLMNTARFTNAAVASVRLGPDNSTLVYKDMQAVKATLLGAGYTRCTELYESNLGDSLPSATNISAVVNKGISFMSWICHGVSTGLSSFSWTTTNINNLTNTGMWPAIWNCSCLNGKFHSVTTCFAEAWMRANTNGNPKGAIGVAMSNLMMMMGASEKIAGDAAKRLVDNTRKNKTYGGITFDTYIKIAIQDYDQPNEFTYMHIFTDPSIMLRTKAPLTMTTTHSTTEPTGISTLTVNCNVEDAYISLTMNKKIIGTAYVTGGKATINFSAITEPDTIFVTGTAFNYIPYMGQVLVANINKPWILYDTHKLNDPNGNNNGKADYAEELNFDVTLKNTGMQDGNNIVSSLTTSDTYVTISDNNEDYGSITNNSSKNQTNAFKCKIAANVPDQHEITFNLATTNNIDNWTSSFKIVCDAPALDITDSNVVLGVYKSDQEYTLFVKAKNTGHSKSPNGTCILSTTSSDITIMYATSNISEVDANGSKVAVFCIKTNQSLAQGTSIPLKFTYTAGSYTVEKTFNLTINAGSKEDFEMGNFNKFAWLLGGNNVTSDKYWSVTNTGANAGTYCAKSGAVGNSSNNDSTMFTSCSLSINLNVTESSKNVSFYKKVSCEKGTSGTSYTWYDYLKFEIDGVIKNRWDGESNWELITYPLSTGTHTLKWTYLKDGYTSSGSDCAWLDEITLPISNSDVPGCFITGIDEEITNQLQTAISLYPNPAKDFVSIDFSLQENSNIKIELFNLIGENVSNVIENKYFSKGSHTFQLNTQFLKPGIYVCKLTTNSDTKTAKFILTN